MNRIAASIRNRLSLRLPQARSLEILSDMGFAFCMEIFYERLYLLVLVF